jgi:hypothetical protein
MGKSLIISSIKFSLNSKRRWRIKKKDEEIENLKLIAEDLMKEIQDRGG